MTTKRVVVKKWDAVNGQLIARYYRIGSLSVSVTQFDSPLMLASPKDAKGKMRIRTLPAYSRPNRESSFFGLGFIKEISDVVNFATQMEGK